MNYKISIKIYTLFLIVVMAASPYASASINVLFYDSVFVNDSKIKLCDIAEISTQKEAGSGEILDRLRQIEIGRSAPPGYSRFVNSNDLVNYRLKKVSGEIDWNIASQKRIHVSTRSRDVQLFDYKEKIYGYIKDNVKWKEGDYTFELLDGTRNITLYDMPADVEIEGLDNSYPRGTLRLTISFDQDGKKKSAAFKCMIKVETRVVVSSDYIKKGETISSSDLALEMRDITRYRNDIYTEKGLIAGSVALRSINPGEIMREILVAKKPAVEKGERFSLVYSSGAVSIEIPVRAREKGCLGERIWVENIKSHKLLRLTLAEKNNRIIGIKEVL